MRAPAGSRADGPPLNIVLTHLFGWPEVRRGGERYLHELAAGLAETGHRVRVITSSSTPHSGDILGVPVTYVQRRRLPVRRLGECAEEAAFGLQAGRRVLPRGADVWHALGTADAAVAATAGKLRGVRSVYTSLGVPERWYRDGRPDRRLHDLVIRHADAYVCLSGAAGAALSSGWGRDPIVVGGGVDLRRFEPAERRHDRPALLYSGTFADARKNVALLLEATALLRRRRPDVELWLSGYGDPAPILAAAPPAARDAAVVLDVGAERDQADRYGRSWVTVLPSEHEAFGLAVVESLACGTPVVVLAEGGGPAEIVTPEVGVACQKSADALADACDQALDMAQTPDIVSSCRAEAARYDWRGVIVPRFEAIYRGQDGTVPA